MLFIDNIVCEFVHFLCEIGGGFFTPFFKLISFLGEKSWFLLLVAVFLCLNKRTRWVALTAIFAVFIGWIIADYGIKPMIARVRPFQSSYPKLYEYWVAAGSVMEDDFSMPSGHTLGVAAFFTSLYITCKKEYRKGILIAGVISVILMTLSRCYFMHHYFTDCLVGAIIGILVSFVAKFIVKLIYKLCKSFPDFFLFNFALNFDLFEFILRKHD